MVWRVMLVLMLSVMPVHASIRHLQWDYPAEARLDAFLLQACPFQRQNCVWRDAQRMGPQRRQVQVQVPEHGRKCFQLWAIVGQRRGGPSNVVCLP